MNEPDRDPDAVESPSAADAALLDHLRAMWEVADPPPRDLAERMVFAVQLERLDAELMALESEILQPVGVRGQEPVRALSFIGSTSSMMVTVTPGAREHRRLDGWVLPHLGGRVVAHRVGGWRRDSPLDADGRFRLDDVPAGLVQLVYEPAGDGTEAARPLAAPPVRV